MENQMNKNMEHDYLKCRLVENQTETEVDTEFIQGFCRIIMVEGA